MSLEGAKFISLDEAGNHGEILLAKGRKFTVGYYMSCDLVLADERSMGIHCEIECDAFGRVTIRNFSQENPILLNGCPVKIKRMLLNNTKLTILSKEYLWKFAKSSNNEFEDIPNESTSTPIKQIGTIPEQPPNSCPNFKFHREVPKRFTVHNFAYCIQSDEEGNVSSDSNDDENADENTQTNENQNEENKTEAVSTQQEEQDLNTNTEDKRNRSLTTEPKEKSTETVDALETPKINLINCTKDKENTSTQKKKNKQLLTMCHQSDVVITSFSPRETGVKIEKSFATVIKPKVLVTIKPATPKSVYSTPTSQLNDNVADEDDKNLMAFYTPSTSKKPSRVLKNSSMHLIDFTTPNKLGPGSPYLKSALKASAKKNIPTVAGGNKSCGKLLSCDEQLGVSTLPSTPDVADVSNSPLETPNSVISVSSCTDSSSTIEVTSGNSSIGTTLGSATTQLTTPVKAPARTAVCTPKRTPQSLMNRAILTSAKKQNTTPQRNATNPTTPRREYINRIPLRSNLALLRSPVTPQASFGNKSTSQLPRRQNMSTPSWKSIPARRCFVNSPSTSNSAMASPSTSSKFTARRSSFNPISAGRVLPTSTPVSGASNTPASCKTSPLHKVRKSVGGIPLSSHISKERRSIALPASTSKFTSIKEKSPQQVMSGRLVSRARKSLCITPISARSREMVGAAKTPPQPSCPFSILKARGIQSARKPERKAVLFADKNPADNDGTDLSRTFIIDSDEEDINDKDKKPQKKPNDVIEIPVDVEEITNLTKNKIESEEEGNAKVDRDQFNSKGKSENKPSPTDNPDNDKKKPLVSEESFGEIINVSQEENEKNLKETRLIDTIEIPDSPKESSQTESQESFAEAVEEIVEENVKEMETAPNISIEDTGTVSTQDCEEKTDAVASGFGEESLVESLNVAREEVERVEEKEISNKNENDNKFELQETEKHHELSVKKSEYQNTAQDMETGNETKETTAIEESKSSEIEKTETKDDEQKSNKYKPIVEDITLEGSLIEKDTDVNKEPFYEDITLVASLLEEKARNEEIKSVNSKELKESVNFKSEKQPENAGDTTVEVEISSSNQELNTSSIQEIGNLEKTNADLELNKSGPVPEQQITNSEKAKDSTVSSTEVTSSTITENLMDDNFENTNKLLEEIEDVLNKSDEIKQKHLIDLEVGMQQDSEKPLTEEFESEKLTEGLTEPIEEVTSTSCANDENEGALLETEEDVNEPENDKNQGALLGTEEVINEPENYINCSEKGEDATSPQEIKISNEVEPYNAEEIIVLDSSQEDVSSLDDEEQTKMLHEKEISTSETSQSNNNSPVEESTETGREVEIFACETEASKQDVKCVVEENNETQWEKVIVQTKSPDNIDNQQDEHVPQISEAKESGKVPQSEDNIPIDDKTDESDKNEEGNGNESEIQVPSVDNPEGKTTKIVEATKSSEESVSDTNNESEAVNKQNNSILKTNKEEIARTVEYKNSDGSTSTGLVAKNVEETANPNPTVAENEEEHKTISQNQEIIDSESETQSAINENVVSISKEESEEHTVGTAEEQTKIVFTKETSNDTVNESESELEQRIDTLAKNIEQRNKSEEIENTEELLISSSITERKIEEVVSFTPRRSTRRASQSADTSQPITDLSFTPRRSARRASMSAETTSVYTPTKITTRRASLSAVNEVPLTPKQITKRRASISIEDEQIKSPITKTPKAETPRKPMEQRMVIPEEMDEVMGTIIIEDEEQSISTEDSKETFAMSKDQMEESNIIADTQIVNEQEQVADMVVVFETADAEEVSLTENKCTKRNEIASKDFLEKNIEKKYTTVDKEVLGIKGKAASKKEESPIGQDDAIDAYGITVEGEETKSLDESYVDKVVTKDYTTALPEPSKQQEDKEKSSGDYEKNEITDSPVNDQLTTDNNTEDEMETLALEDDIENTPKKEMQIIKTDQKTVKILADSPKTPRMTGVRELLKTPKADVGTPRLGGIHDLVGTPKAKLKLDKEEEMEKLAVVADLVKTPQVLGAQTKDDIEISTPKAKKQVLIVADSLETPIMTCMRELLKTPKQEMSTPKLVGLRNLVQTPKPKIETEEEEETEKLAIVAELVRTPQTSEVIADETPSSSSIKRDNLKGVKELLKTPKGCSTPRFMGMRELMQTPKISSTPQMCGIKELLNSPAVQQKEEELQEDSTDQDKTEQIPAANVVNLKGVKELLKTPKSSSSPRLKGLRELMQTPKITSTPVMGGIKELMETPLQTKEHELEKFLRTPTARNIMISTMPSSAIIEKSSDSIEVPTEYDLNATHERETENLEDLFKTPVPSRFVERIAASYYGEEDEELDETLEKLNKTSNVTLPEEVVEKETPMRSTIKLKSFGLQTPQPQPQSPFNAADVLSDLPKNDVEEWVEKLENVEMLAEVEDESVVKEDNEKVSALQYSSSESSNKDISIPESCVKVYLSEKSLTNIVTASLTNTQTKDPLLMSSNKREKVSRPVTLVDAEISGIDLLDQTVESLHDEPLVTEEPSMFEEPLMVSDNESTVEDNDNDLSEPLILSDSEELNQSQVTDANEAEAKEVPITSENEQEKSILAKADSTFVEDPLKVNDEEVSLSDGEEKDTEVKTPEIAELFIKEKVEEHIVATTTIIESVKESLTPEDTRITPADEDDSNKVEIKVQESSSSIIDAEPQNGKAEIEIPSNELDAVVDAAETEVSVVDSDAKEIAIKETKVESEKSNEIAIDTTNTEIFEETNVANEEQENSKWNKKQLNDQLDHECEDIFMDNSNIDESFGDEAQMDQIVTTKKVDADLPQVITPTEFGASKIEKSITEEEIVLENTDEANSEIVEVSAEIVEINVEKLIPPPEEIESDEKSLESNEIVSELCSEEEESAATLTTKEECIHEIVAGISQERQTSSDEAIEEVLDQETRVSEEEMMKEKVTIIPEVPTVNEEMLEKPHTELALSIEENDATETSQQDSVPNLEPSDDKELSETVKPSDDEISVSSDNQKNIEETNVQTLEESHIEIKESLSSEAIGDKSVEHKEEVIAIPSISKGPQKEIEDVNPNSEKNTSVLEEAEGIPAEVIPEIFVQVSEGTTLEQRELPLTHTEIAIAYVKINDRDSQNVTTIEPDAGKRTNSQSSETVKPRRKRTASESNLGLVKDGYNTSTRRDRRRVQKSTMEETVIEQKDEEQPERKLPIEDKQIEEINEIQEEVVTESCKEMEAVNPSEDPIIIQNKDQIVVTERMPEEPKESVDVTESEMNEEISSVKQQQIISEDQEKISSTVEVKDENDKQFMRPDEAGGSNLDAVEINPNETEPKIEVTVQQAQVKLPKEPLPIETSGEIQKDISKDVFVQQQKFLEDTDTSTLKATKQITDIPQDITPITEATLQHQGQGLLPALANEEPIETQSNIPKETAEENKDQSHKHSRRKATPSKHIFLPVDDDKTNSSSEKQVISREDLQKDIAVDFKSKLSDIIEMPEPEEDSEAADIYLQNVEDVQLTTVDTVESNVHDVKDIPTTSAGEPKEQPVRRGRYKHTLSESSLDSVHDEDTTTRSRKFCRKIQKTPIEEVVVEETVEMDDVIYQNEPVETLTDKPTPEDQSVTSEEVKEQAVRRGRREPTVSESSQGSVHEDSTTRTGRSLRKVQKTPVDVIVIEEDEEQTTTVQPDTPTEPLVSEDTSKEQTVPELNPDLVHEDDSARTGRSQQQSLPVDQSELPLESLVNAGTSNEPEVPQSNQGSVHEDDTMRIGRSRRKVVNSFDDIAIEQISAVIKDKKENSNEAVQNEMLPSDLETQHINKKVSEDQSAETAIEEQTENDVKEESKDIGVKRGRRKRDIAEPHTEEPTTSLKGRRKVQVPTYIEPLMADTITLNEVGDITETKTSDHPSRVDSVEIIDEDKAQKKLEEIQEEQEDKQRTEVSTKHIPKRGGRRKVVVDTNVMETITENEVAYTTRRGGRHKPTASESNKTELPKIRSTSRNRKAQTEQTTSVDVIEEIPTDSNVSKEQRNTFEIVEIAKPMIVILDVSNEDKLSDDELISSKEARQSAGEGGKKPLKRTRTASEKSQDSVTEEKPTKRRARHQTTEIEEVHEENKETISTELKGNLSNKIQDNIQEAQAEKEVSEQPQKSTRRRGAAAVHDGHLEEASKKPRRRRAKHDETQLIHPAEGELHFSEINQEPETLLLDQHSSPEEHSQEINVGTELKNVSDEVQHHDDHDLPEEHEHSTKRLVGRRKHVAEEHKAEEEPSSSGAHIEGSEVTSKRRYVNRRKLNHDKEEHHEQGETIHGENTETTSTRRGGKKKQEHGEPQTEKHDTDENTKDTEISESTSKRRNVDRKKYDLEVPENQIKEKPDNEEEPEPTTSRRRLVCTKKHELEHYNTGYTVSADMVVEQAPQEETKKGRARRKKNDHSEETEQATQASHSPETKHRGRKRKESHTDTQDHVSEEKEHNEEKLMKETPITTDTISVEVQTPQRRGRKASTIEHITAESQEVDDTSGRRARNVPQRRAATAYHNYDETSDSEVAPKPKKKTESPRKSLEVTKASPTATIIPSAQLINLSPSHSSTAATTTARGRTRKPTAKVQQFLEEERAKAETPKKRGLLAAAIGVDSVTPQRTPARRGRKPSAIETEVEGTPQATKGRARGGRHAVAATKESHSHSDVLESVAAVPVEEVKVIDSHTTPPLAQPSKSRKGGRKAKIVEEQHNTDEPPAKKSSLELEIEKQHSSPAADAPNPPTRIAGRRNAAAAAKARIEEDALAAAAIDPPKRPRARKAAAKVATPVVTISDVDVPNSSVADEEKAPKIQNSPEKQEQILASASTLEGAEDLDGAIEIEPAIKRGRKAVTSAATTSDSPAVPVKRSRKPKLTEEIADGETPGESKTTRGRGRGRKNVHFDEHQEVEATASSQQTTTDVEPTVADTSEPVKRGRTRRK